MFIRIRICTTFLLLGCVCACVLADENEEFEEEEDGDYDYEFDDEGDENILHKDNFVHDTKHIQAHLKHKLKFDAQAATPEELDFHFFKMHDLDDNNVLDGLEILSALNHVIHKHQTNPDVRAKAKQRVIMQVDQILKDDDNNSDGYISYPEFVNTRRASTMLKQANQVASKL